MSAKDNLSLVLHKKGDMRLEQRPIPVPGKNEVLVAVHSVGICGSDVHYLTHGQIGDFIVKAPMVLGHESSGTVVKVGEGVKTLKPGDRVAMEVGIPCRSCDYCKIGRYNLCPQMQFAATPPYDGTLTRYYVQPEDFCFKLPDHVSYEEGAMLEPLSVAVAGCRRGKVGMGDIVLITGSGPIGLLHLMTAQALGVSKVCMTDIDPGRLATAKKLGANAVVQIQGSQTIEEQAKQIEEALGEKPTVTLECCGFESAVRLGIEATRCGGRIVLIGMGPSEMKIPLIIAAIKEVDLIGNFRYCNTYPTALSLIASGKVDVKKIITHHFKLEQSAEAFEVSRTARDGAIKVIIECYQ